MNAQNPVTLVNENDTTESDAAVTVITARFNRKKIARIAGAAAAALGLLVVGAAVMKSRGYSEALDDVESLSDDTDESVAS